MMADAAVVINMTSIQKPNGFKMSAYYKPVSIQSCEFNLYAKFEISHKTFTPFASKENKIVTSW